MVILYDDDLFVAGGVDRLVAKLRESAEQYLVILFGVRVVDERERVKEAIAFHRSGRVDGG